MSGDGFDNDTASPGEFAGLDEVVSAIRGLANPPDPVRAQSAIAGAAQIARLAAESGVGADTAVSGSPEPRRKAMLKTLVSGALAKVLLASSVAIAAVGGVAATGNLPGPLQDGVAYVVEPIGLDIPSSDDSTTTIESWTTSSEVTSTTGATSSTSTMGTTSTTADDADDDDDDRSGSSATSTTLDDDDDDRTGSSITPTTLDDDDHEDDDDDNTSTTIDDDDDDDDDDDGADDITSTTADGDDDDDSSKEDD